MVSAKKDDIDKIRGLGLGADDYITKPFSARVRLVARVKAHLARYETPDRQYGTRKMILLRSVASSIDKTARRVWVNERRRTVYDERV